MQQNPSDRCEGIFFGAEFNKKNAKCEKVSWGCGDPPFKTIEDCKMICESQIIR